MVSRRIQTWPYANTSYVPEKETNNKLREYDWCSTIETPNISCHGFANDKDGIMPIKEFIYYVKRISNSTNNKFVKYIYIYMYI